MLQLPGCVSSNGNTWGRQREPVIASHRGRRRGGPEVTGPFTGDKKTREEEEGNGTGGGPKPGGQRRQRCCRALQRDDQRHISSIHPVMRDEDNLMYSIHMRITDEELRLNSRLSLCLELLSTEFNVSQHK